MLHRGRGGGQNLFFSVALVSLAAVSAAAFTYRAPLQEIWERLRIRWKPAHVFDLLERDPGSPGGKAARWFSRTAEGRDLMFRTYLKEQVWEKAGFFLAARFRDSGALVLWTGSDG